MIPLRRSTLMLPLLALTLCYGYGDYTSCMYPGGLDLTPITTPPPR
jgi:hypothetical protein